jgi:site-specific DNA recombinase
MAERRRCAIYTRKSTEEGLEQDFNSLHAQREACDAYIASQRSEGWTMIQTAYDDGGFSGGSMARPALSRLLADIALGKIDVVVVYKVDRLTRSLADFAKIVEILDRQQVSFVSITQSFNTTSSMGRLTLNVLLSFAQFEREVTAERIRDKIAASKAKGMWMGGTRPMGYRPENRRLVIVPEEAATVRHIFARFAVLRSADRLVEELDRDAIYSAVRISKTGNRSGGVKLRRGQIYCVLSNPVYRGLVRHKKLVHPGEHEPIIDQAAWDETQAILALGKGRLGRPRNTQHASVLAGLIVDGHGRPMSPSHANKAGRRYRYYITHKHHLQSSNAPPAWRVSAGDLETLVTSVLADHLANSAWISGSIGCDDAGASTAGEAIAARLRSSLPQLRSTLDELGAKIQLGSDQLRLLIDPSRLRRAVGIAPPIENDALESVTIVIPCKMVRAGKEMKLVQVDRDAVPAIDSPLLRLIGKAAAARRLWMQGKVTDDALAEKLGFSRAYLRTLLRVSFLAPDIMAAIIAGEQPVGLGEHRLLRATHLPLEWTQQGESLGF